MKINEINRSSAMLNLQEDAMIKIKKQDDPEPPFELCCFCRNPTMYWTQLSDRTPGQQVACCPECSSLHLSKDVPTKREWCDKERRLRKLIEEFPSVSKSTETSFDFIRQFEQDKAITCQDAALLFEERASRSPYRVDAARYRGQAEILKFFGETPVPEKLIEEFPGIFEKKTKSKKK